MKVIPETTIPVPQFNKNTGLSFVEHILVMSSVLGCPLRVPHENDVRFLFTSSYFVSYKTISVLLIVKSNESLVCDRQKIKNYIKRTKRTNWTFNL
jgi:hypothetical protein